MSFVAFLPHVLLLLFFYLSSLSSTVARESSYHRVPRRSTESTIRGSHLVEKRHTISRKEMEVVRERKGVKSGSRIVCYNKTVNFLEGGERGESDRLDGRPCGTVHFCTAS